MGEINTSPYSPGIFNSLVVGHSALTPGGCRSLSSGVVAPEEHVLTVAGTTFVNFDAGECVALSGCSQCTDVRAGSAVRAEGLAFVNSPNKVRATHVDTFITTSVLA